VKNTQVSEMIEKENLTVLLDSETLESFFKMKSSKSNCYVVNKENILQGVIDNRIVLEYTAPMLALVDRKNSRNLMQRIKKIPLRDIIEKPGKTLSMKSTIHEIFLDLQLGSRDALPVLDTKGVLIGEITILHIFETLNSERDNSTENTERALKAV